MTKAKFKDGKTIRSVAEFEQSQKMWFRWRKKTVHRAWLESLQYRGLKHYIELGTIREADDI